MKLLAVTCLKEYLNNVSKIFKQANIDVFSTSEIVGHRNGAPLNLLENWFTSGGEQVDSMMIFTFTSATNAEHGMALIKDYNVSLKENFPVRAFVVPVEKSI
jgi:hypothetical protein